MTTTNSSRDKLFSRMAIFDWVTAIVLLAFGIWQVIATWTSPEWWAWLSLAFGVIGIPLAAINPGKRLNTWVMRRAVKKR